MPRDLIVDEKITWVDGQEVVVPTTASGGCFLGITVSERDNTEGLQAAYGKFASEAKAVFPDYRPLSVCTDGWAATREAWRLLFPQITLVLCYLHSVIKIAARCTGQLRQEVLTRVWHVYRAETKSKFSQRLRRLGHQKVCAWRFGRWPCSGTFILTASDCVRRSRGGFPRFMTSTALFITRTGCITS